MKQNIVLKMKPPSNNFQKAIAASYTLIGSLIIFGGIGYFLKNKFKNDYWLTGCLIFGAMIGLYELYKHINK